MVYKLAITNGVVMFQEADGILARFVLPPAKRLLIKTDYYTAPNCNALCSSGSGTPKANGTQECSCIDTTQTILTAGSTSSLRGSYYGFYPPTKIGSLSSNIFRESKITRFYTKTKTSKTYLVFESAPNDQSEIKVKVNGTIYILTKSAASDKEWTCDSKIFTSTGTYEIEFLN